jgi:hypothetical protein
MHVVDEQHIDFTVFLPELAEGLLFDGVHELVGELLGGDVTHIGARFASQHLLADGLHEVCLAETRGAVKKQWIVNAAGLFGNRASDSEGVAAVWASNEAVEVELGVQTGVAEESNRCLVGGVDTRGFDFRHRHKCGTGRHRFCGNVKFNRSRNTRDLSHGIGHGGGVIALDPQLVDWIRHGDDEPTIIRKASASAAEATLEIVSTETLT